MEKDQKKINKFLELFPDGLAERVFHSLERNMIQDNEVSLMRVYPKYIKKFGLSFEDKALKLNHSRFYEAFEKLNHFVLECFFRIIPENNFHVLHPDLKKRNLNEWKKFADRLEKTLKDTEDEYEIFRKSIETYLLENNAAGTKTIDEGTSKKYSNANEDILLKTLGITIKGNYIFRGKAKTKINVTDKALMYFLYFKALKNPDECFTLKDLSTSKDIGKSERYIKNRITIINASIEGIISKDLKLKIGKLIKREGARGYHLDPRILLIKQKK
jgi:hypothetical protein